MCSATLLSETLVALLWLVAAWARSAASSSRSARSKAVVVGLVVVVAAAAAAEDCLAISAFISASSRRRVERSVSSVGGGVVPGARLITVGGGVPACALTLVGVGVGPASALLVAGDASNRTNAEKAFGVDAGVVFWFLAGLVLGLFACKVTERCVKSLGRLVAYLFLKCLFLINLLCNTRREAK